MYPPLLKPRPTGASIGGLLLLLSTLTPLLAPKLLYGAEISCAHTIKNETPSGAAQRFKLAYCHIDQGNYEKARALLEGLEKELPHVEEYVHYYRGLAEKKSENPERAIEHFQRALEGAPSKGLRRRVLRNLAETHFDSEDYQRALSAYAELYGIDQRRRVRATALMREGKALHELGRHKEALSKWKELWSRYPESELADEALRQALRTSKLHNIPLRITPLDHRKRADILFKHQRWKSAYEDYRKGPITPGAKLNMAICKYRLGEYREASSLLSGLESPEALWWLSNIKLKLGRDSEAIYSLSRIHFYFPHSPKAEAGLYRAARLAEIEGEHEEAEGLFRKLIEKYPHGPYVSEANWHLGWIYYKKGDYEGAKRVFGGLGGEKAEYWEARALEKMGRTEEALAIYTALAIGSTPSYYSYLAQEKTGLRPPLSAPTNETPKTSENPGKGASGIDHPRMRSALFFIELGIYGDALAELDEIELGSLTLEQMIEIVRLYERAEEPYLSIKLASRIDSGDSLEFAYPRGTRELVSYFANHYGVDEYHVYSIIREESRFQTKAVSPAGAIGLMQIMPETGRRTARSVGISNYSRSLLYTPSANINLGIAYFKSLLDRFGGELVYALAGYNGGPHNVDKWREKLKELEIDEFVEEIPFKETRNYVKKVLRTYGVYRAIYDSSA